MPSSYWFAYVLCFVRLLLWASVFPLSWIGLHVTQTAILKQAWSLLGPCTATVLWFCLSWYNLNTYVEELFILFVCNSYLLFWGESTPHLCFRNWINVLIRVTARDPCSCGLCDRVILAWNLKEIRAISLSYHWLFYKTFTILLCYHSLIYIFVISLIFIIYSFINCVNECLCILEY
jgi:hypothetical protein